MSFRMAASSAFGCTMLTYHVVSVAWEPEITHVTHIQRWTAQRVLAYGIGERDTRRVNTSKRDGV